MDRAWTTCASFSWGWCLRTSWSGIVGEVGYNFSSELEYSSCANLIWKIICTQRQGMKEASG